ncbi:MAG TPA: hypothetical protein DHW02_15065 [Ktedonobacter sp.]|nr:hypothetical protein [Ktedonobacter sp.]
MSQAPASLAQPPSFRMLFRSLLPSILVNGVLVYLIYTLLKSYTSTSDLVALLISSVPAVLSEIVTIMRHRQLDVLGIIVLAFIAISAVVSFIGGDAKLLLIRESFLTAGLAVACVVSLLFPRPLMFYIIRYFATGNDPSKSSIFNSRWQYSAFRRYIRIISVVWGIAYLAEFFIRLYMVYHLSIQQYLSIGPLVFYGLTFGVIGITLAYGRRMISQITQTRIQNEEREGTSTSIQA